MDNTLNSSGRPPGRVQPGPTHPGIPRRAPEPPPHAHTGSIPKRSRSPDGQQSIKELLHKVQLEEKIRDGAENMLQELEFSNAQQSSKYKVKTAPSSEFLAHRKRIIAQVEASESRIESLKSQLRDHGHDVDSSDADADDDDGNDSDNISVRNIEGEEERRSHYWDAASGSTSDLSRTRQHSGDPSFLMSMPVSSAGAGNNGNTGNIESNRRRSDDTNNASHQGPPTAAPTDPYAAANHSVNTTTTANELTLETSSKYFLKLFAALDPSKPAANDVRTIDKLSELFQLFPAVRSEIAIDQACDKVKGYFVNKTTHHKILGYKLCRLISADRAALTTIQTQLQTDWLVVQSLAHEDSSSFHNERLEALHFARLCLQLDSLNHSVVRAIVAVAEQPSDKLRNISLETLAELLVVEPVLAFEGGALKVLLNILIEGPTQLAVCLTQAMLQVLDDPYLRHFLRDGQDLAIVTTVFSEAQLYGMSTPSTERIQTACLVIKTILRSWPGIYSFDLTWLTECLSVPVKNVQSALLDVISESLSVAEIESGSIDTDPEPIFSPYSSQFTALLLQRFMDAGLNAQLAIFGVPGSAHPEVRIKARDLYTEMCMLSSKLLPHRVLQLDKIAPFPSDVPTYGLPTAVIPLFSVSNALQEAAIKPFRDPSSTRDNETFARMGSQMDDASFKHLINSTHVLDTKIHKQWNWDALLELIQGPLRSPKRLDVALRNPRFLKRLSSFYRPFKLRFSSVNESKDGLRYAKVGKELFASLLDTPEGATYLAGNKVITQIAECLAQLDPNSNVKTKDPFFNPRRFKKTLCYVYIEMIGILSRSPTGQQILATYRVFNMLYRIIPTGRDDIMRAIIRSLDYSVTGHSRIILSKILTSTSRSMRLFATRYMTKLASTSPETQKWAVEALVGQLYDVDQGVCHAAVDGLVVFCRKSENLDLFIALKPFLSHLGEASTTLSMLFLSRPAGFLLVQQIRKDYVDREMDSWAHGLNEQYTDRIEEFLDIENDSERRKLYRNVLSENTDSALTPDANLRASIGSFSGLSKVEINHRLAVAGAKLDDAPRHFFGELVLTDQGCALLKKYGHVEALASFVSNNKFATDPVEVRQLKGTIWALGHIASRQLGAQLISTDMVRDITEVFKTSPVYSVRGTAFYSLGLMSRSFEGAELLWQNGWAVAYDTYGRSRGVAVPDTSKAALEGISRESTINTVRLEGLSRASSREATTKGEDEGQAANSGGPYLQINGADASGSGSRERSVTASSIDSPSEFYNDANRGNSSGALGRIQHHELHMADFDFTPDPPRIPGPSNSQRSIASQASTNSGGASAAGSIIDFPGLKDPAADEILRAVSGLSNYVLAHDASKRLVALRAVNPVPFQTPDVFREMIKLLEEGHYKQLVRRFVFELFDMDAVLEKSFRRRRGSRIV